MPKLPIKQLKKSELEWLASNYCKAHGHSFLEHYNCYLTEKPDTSPFKERVGFFDIETSSLNASFGYILSYAILEDDGDKIYGRTITSNEVKKYIFDRDLIKECVEDLNKFHRIVVHWGADRRFDAPFARSRALYHGVDFPLYKDIYIEDTWLMAKNKLRLYSNRLEAIGDFLNIPAKGHKLKPTIWQKALAGDRESLDYLWTHNVEDVLTTKEVWRRLHDFMPRGKRSI